MKESKKSVVLDNDEKSRTFRKRRLTCVKHHLEPAATDDDSSTKSNASFRDRRLTLTHKASEPPTSPKRPKTNDSKLQSRVVHAGQLHPVSPSSKEKNRLYQQPFQVEPVETEEDRASKPPWRHRHTRRHSEHDDELPFPRHVVGTYSCHGVEPVYDSEYEDMEDEDDDDDDDDWTPPGGKVLPKNKSEAASSESSSKEEEESKEEDTVATTTVAKINQDRGGVAYPYGNSNRTALLAAYDGHGQGGELVSQYALHEVQRRLEKHPDFHSNVEKAFKETFVNVDEDLKKEELIDPLYAGTTACVLLIRDNHMFISNVGDSRAVLARRNKDGGLEAMDLSKDQNPDVPEEKERIERNGGFVSAPLEEGLSARVWLDDSYSQIGLAMARSIGDHAVASVGVIAEPVVTQHEIQEDDDFLIIATDGVWEFIESDEAVGIVEQHLQAGATKACQALIEASANKWHEEEGNYRDDITALVVRLQELWGSATNN